MSYKYLEQVFDLSSQFLTNIHLSQQILVHARVELSRGLDNNILSQPSGRCSSLSDPTASSTPASAVQPTRKMTMPLEKKQEQFFDVAKSVLGNQNKFKAFGNNVAFQLDDMDRDQQVIREKLFPMFYFTVN